MRFWNWLKKWLRWNDTEEVVEVDLPRVEEKIDLPPIVKVKEREALFYIRITKIPDGNAPEWVRKEWVGLLLPCVEETNTGGCALNPVSTWEQTTDNKGIPPRGRVYKVPVSLALKILEQKSPAAAQCFRDMLGGYCGEFTFSVSEAEKVDVVKEAV
ncbi:MAG: hypothetical protein WCV41_02855 [Patescibacteria group bacterium]